MTVREAVSASLRLLTRRDRRRLFAATLLQMATSLLDLAGVLLIGVLGVLLVSAAQDLPAPGIVLRLQDILGLGELDVSQMTALIGGMAAAFLLLKSVAAVLITRRILNFLANRGVEVSARLSAALLARPLLEVRQWPSQVAAYAVGGGVTSAVSGVLGAYVIAWSELTLLAVLGIAMLVVDPVVTVAAIVYFGLVGSVLHRFLGQFAERAARTTSETDIRSRSLIQEAIDCYRETYVSDRRQTYSQRFASIRRLSARSAADLQFISQLPKYVLEASLVLGAALLIAALLATESAADATGTLALFLAAGARVMPSIMRLQGATTGIRSGSGMATRTYEVADFLETRPTSGSRSQSVAELRDRVAVGFDDFDPSIDILGVSVSYPGASEPALVDVTFRVPSGSSVALAGPTGAGKSTLADVLLGVLEPGEGTVLLGGTSPGCAVRRWPGGIGYVPQDVALTDGTARENVALGLPPEAIDDDLVWEALRRAKLADFLESSRDGLDTAVGEHGVRLSGGQRQRLGVARALYTRPRLLVLDEATSALDAETERAISDTFAGLGPGVTTVTIAHRLATIREADLVLYLEDGRVRFQGSFDEVRDAVPGFRRQAQLLGL